MEKELLFEAKENASSINIKEFSPEGAKIDITLRMSSKFLQDSEAHIVKRLMTFGFGEKL